LDCSIVIVETGQRRRLSRENWLALALLPILTIVVPALLGHPPILGDNATQNISLRWLVGQDYRQGNMPTWNPFNWDGTPLLAGFNAGALYPLMVLFLLLPAGFAMTLTLALSWILAEFAIVQIARQIGISRWFAIGAGIVFVGSGAAAAGGMGMLMVPTAEAAPARAMAVGGAALDLVMSMTMESEMGLSAEPMHDGAAGSYLKAARAFTVAGAVAAVLGRRSRAAAALAGGSLLAGSLCTRLGIFHAGQQSASDPRYTVVPQRRRLDAGMPVRADA
jgi:hypothetical protein